MIPPFPIFILALSGAGLGARERQGTYPSGRSMDGIGWLGGRHSWTTAQLTVHGVQGRRAPDFQTRGGSSARDMFSSIARSLLFHDHVGGAGLW